MKKHSNVIAENEVAWAELSRGRGFRYRRRILGEAAGSAKLGCSLYEIPPGASAFPLHFHTANEEAIFVLAGAGTLTLGDAQVAVGAGDYVAMPAGPANAHKLVNTSQAPLRYLCISTMNEVEVCGYPESDKLGIGVGPRGKRTIAASFRRDSAVDYYDGEPDAS
jgi:uncharacterized cupin superfamily protein